MPWWDFYKIFTFAFENDPQTKRKKSASLVGAGIGGPDVVQYMMDRDGVLSPDGGKVSKLRIGSDMIDTTSVSNRMNRIKEYERLRSMPEIEQVMTVIADEACISGDTEVNTLSDGLKPIKWLAENKKDQEFFVYSWDFEKNDYTLGVAYDPRFVKKEKTIKVILDDGTFFIATRDHLVLLKSGAWAMSGELRIGDELMPFYKVTANQELTKNRRNQYPRIYTNSEGWVHERQFIDEWKSGKSLERYEKVNKAVRMLAGGLTCREISKLMGHHWETIETWIKNEGFSYKEIKWLAKKRPSRRVIATIDWAEVDVYDLSVKDHKNFCGKSVIFHNCQKNDDDQVLKVTCKNEEIQKELEFLFLHRKMLNFNRRLWGYTKRTCINGDLFLEVILNPDNPKDGIMKVQELPPESVYRIETDKGKVLEFQQGSSGPDYEAILRTPVTDASDSELEQSKAIRFAPEQIVHVRLGEDRKTFYPYGQSLIEPARGPAHQLRLMEDSMVVYRLTRAPERRVFYIDVGTMPSYRAESFMTRMQDLLRKKKTVKSPGEGASAVEEKFVPPSPDEDIFIPVRPNSATKVDTLPGAQNLGEIDDTVYFRNKLYISLNFPSNYFANDDVQATRITLSSQNIKFARMIERIQEHMEDGLWEIADRHLRLIGYPEEAYEDLKIKMTPNSEWRRLSRMELINAQINNANSLKGSMLYSDWDILTKVLEHPEDESIQMISRMKIQKMEEARLQILVQNPQLTGIGTPGAGEEQLGTEPDGPNPMLGPDDQGQGPPPEDGGGGAPPPPEHHKANPEKRGSILAEPEEDEVRRYDLEILSYSQEQDAEDVDWSDS